MKRRGADVKRSVDVSFQPSSLQSTMLMYPFNLAVQMENDAEKCRLQSETCPSKDRTQHQSCIACSRFCASAGPTMPLHHAQHPGQTEPRGSGARKHWAIRNNAKSGRNIWVCLSPHCALTPKDLTYVS